MREQYTPTLILAPVDIGEVDDELLLVCSNCGHRFFSSEGAHPDEKDLHLSACVEIKAPFVWTVKKLESSTEEEENGITPFELFCNGRLIIKGDDEFPNVVDLNRWQCTPFEFVTDEYIYKYNFNKHFGKEFPYVFDQLGEAIALAEDGQKMFARGEAYMSDVYKVKYREGLTTAITALKVAQVALEAVAMLPKLAAAPAAKGLLQ